MSIVLMKSFLQYSYFSTELKACVALDIIGCGEANIPLEQASMDLYPKRACAGHAGFVVPCLGIRAIFATISKLCGIGKTSLLLPITI